MMIVHAAKPLFAGAEGAPHFLAPEKRGWPPVARETWVAPSRRAEIATMNASSCGSLGWGIDRAMTKPDRHL